MLSCVRESERVRKRKKKGSFSLSSTPPKKKKKNPPSFLHTIAGDQINCSPRAALTAEYTP